MYAIRSYYARIGLFSAFDATSYLRYDDTLQEFVQLMRQPGSKYMEYISEFKNAAVVPALIDPTRGVLLSMLKEKATVSERIDHVITSYSIHYTKLYEVGQSYSKNIGGVESKGVELSGLYMLTSAWKLSA